MEEENLLISQLEKDSEAALAKLYELYAPRLYTLAMRYTKSRETTQELVQDVFVWLWDNRGRIRRKDSVQALLFIRMRHYLINAYRSTVNSPVYYDYLLCQEQTATDEASHLAEYDDFVQALERAMRQLPPTQQRVVRLSRMEQLTNKDIARRLSLTEQTVRNQLSLGLKRLRQLMGLLPLVLLEILFVVKNACNTCYKWF